MHYRPLPLVVLVLLTLLVVPGGRVPASPGPGLRIVGPAGETTPVVNEGGRLQLKVVDGGGNAVSVQSWSTDNKQVGKVNRMRGLLKGKAFGFATITARTGQGDVSGFVVVARVRSQTGAMARGDTKTDTGGNVYLSSPARHVLYRATAVSAEVFAGGVDQSGYTEGTGNGIRFNGPSGIGVDNRAEGGLYVADTMNSVIRKVDFRGRSTLAAGVPGFEGTMHGDENPIEDAVFDGPKGVASVGSNLYVTDTNNDCVWYVDVQRQVVELVAGDPGEAGNQNGQGRQARFDHPSGIAINTRGNLLAVADTGNNVVRLIAIAPRQGGGVIGNVTTLGLSSSARNADILDALQKDRGTDEIGFDAPISVSFDGVDNVYVIDNQTASVVTRGNGFVERVNLAQGGTLGDPASVTVRRTQAFVLNETPQSEADALRVVEVGAPTIATVTPDTARLEGGAPVVITGTNFARESKLTLGDAEVTNYTVESSTRITFTVPAQQAPGGRTVTVLTRGGLTQAKFTVLSPPLDSLQMGDITTVNGGVPFTGDGGPAIRAFLYYPNKIQLDGAGNLFIVDAAAYRIRRIDGTTGAITTIAGTGVRGFSGDGGLATAAAIDEVASIAIDPTGNLYLADGGNNRIRRVDAATGVINTVAGSDEFNSAGDGGPFSQCSLGGPGFVTFDPAGNLYFTDGSRIRRVDGATGIVDKFAGNESATSDGDGGPALAARFSYLVDIASDAEGNIFLIDGNRVRRIDASTRIISAFAGTGTAGYSGDGGPAVLATFNSPLGLALDSDGGVLIADHFNNAVRRIDAASGMVSTIAGNGTFGNSVEGLPARESPVSFPLSVAADGFGNVIIGVEVEALVRMIDARTGLLNSLAGIYVGSDSAIGDGDQFAKAALFPNGIAFDRSNNLYVSDYLNNRVRFVEATTGRVSTIAGTGAIGFEGDGGLARLATFRAPGDLCVAPNGDLLVADGGNRRIRRISSTNGTITTIAGTGVRGNSGDGGPATQCSYGSIQGLVADAASNIYFADYTFSTIRRITATDGTVTAVAGTGISGFNGDGIPAITAKINHPRSLKITSNGNLLFADHNNSRIREIDAGTGILRTVGGNGMQTPVQDGVAATSTSVLYPTDAVCDGAGNIFLFDGSASGGRRRVRRIDAVTGIITTIAGGDRDGYSGDGGPGRLAILGLILELEIDSDGNLYLRGEFSIRVLKGVAVPLKQ